MKFIILITFIIVLIVGVVFATSNKDNFCGSDGKLTHKKSVQSHRSYCMKALENSQYQPSSSSTFSYSIVDDQGNTVKQFEIVHEKIMHFIVVRKDLAHFQHLHPEFDPETGIFTISDLVFPANGEYRLYADFTPMTLGVGLPVIVSNDVHVGEPSKYVSEKIVVDNDKVKVVNGYTINMLTNPAQPIQGENTLFAFSIRKDGVLVKDIEPYLGARGHAVIIKEGSLQFIHTHPSQTIISEQTGEIRFDVTLPETGVYKNFVQFKHKGNIVTDDFGFEVAQNPDQATSNIQAPSAIDHSAH